MNPISKTIRRVQTHRLVRSRGTDVKRWAQESNYSETWSGRHAVMVEGIKPGDHVVDLGSGPRSFERRLPEGCTYTPVDVAERGPGSIVCDFNNEPLPAITADFVVMSGVTEYLHDPAAFLSQAREIAPRGVVSYCVLELHPDIATRRAMAWINDYTRAEFAAMLVSAGWTIGAESEWDDSQIIFHLA